MFEDILDTSESKAFSDVLDKPNDKPFSDILDEAQGIIQRDVVQPLKELPKAIVRAPVDFSAKVGAEIPAAWDKGTVDLLDAKLSDVNDKIRVTEARIGSGKRSPSSPDFPQPGFKALVGLETPQEVNARQQAFLNQPATPEDTKLLADLQAQKADLEAQRAKAEADRASWAGTAAGMKASVRKGVLAEPANPSMPTRIVQGTFGAWPEWMLMGAAGRAGVGGRLFLPLQNAINQEAAVGTGAQPEFSYRDLAKSGIEGLILDKAHFIEAKPGASKLRQAAAEVLDTIPQSQLVLIPEIADRVAKGEAITPEWLVENSLTSLGNLLVYKSTGLIGKTAGGIKDVVKEAYEARVPYADAAKVAESMVAQYGKDAVQTPDEKTVIVRTPNGKRLVYSFVKDYSEVNKSPEDFFEGVRSKSPKEADAYLEAHGGDKKAAGAALMKIYDAAGATTKNVMIRDPETGEMVNADTLVQLVSGKAKIGDLKHEDLHALIRLSGADMGTQMSKAREEELAYAFERGINHPVIQKALDFANRIVSVFSRGGETPFQTAQRMHDQLQQVVKGEGNALEIGRTETLGEQPGRPQGPGQEISGRVQPGQPRPEAAGAEGIQRPSGAPNDGGISEPLGPIPVQSKAESPEPISVAASARIEPKQDVSFSVRGFDKRDQNGDRVWEREFRGGALARGFKQEDVDSSVAQIDAVAKIFKKYPDILPNEPKEVDAGKPASAVYDNADFKHTLDINRICQRTREYYATLRSVESKVKHFLTPDEMLSLAQYMRKSGDIPFCIFCYVEAGRRAARRNAIAFLRLSGSEASEKRSGNKPTALEDLIPKRDRLLKKLGWSNDQLEQTLASPEATQKWIKKSGDFREIAQIFRSYVLGAKGTALAENGEYNHEFLNWSAKEVADTNQRAGVRAFSATGLDPTQIVDAFQAFADATVRRMAMHGYTKDAFTALIFGDTGMKGNLSVAVDGRGPFKPDVVNGMDHNLASKLVKRYPNFGMMFVAKNHEQVKWALLNDWVNMIIPHHAANWSKGQYQKFDLEDMAYAQKETWIDAAKAPMGEDGKRMTPKKAYGNRLWLNYWLKLNNNNEARAVRDYVNFCDTHNLVPKWMDPRFLESIGMTREELLQSNYIKLIKDYARTDTPQVPVNDKKINLPEAKRYLKQFVRAGGREKLDQPNPETVDQFVRDYQAGEIVPIETMEQQLTNVRVPAAQTASELGVSSLPSGKAPSYESVASVRRKTHQTAERVAESGMLGPVLSEKLKADEAAKFEPQKLKDIAEQVRQTPDAVIEERLSKLDALGAEDSPQNDLGALLVEKINRQRAAGDTSGAYDTVIRASKNYGAVAQILRQAAMLKTSTPEGMAEVSVVISEKAGHKVTDSERRSLADLAEVDIFARRELEKAEEQFVSSPTKVTAQKLDVARAAAEKANRRFVNRTTDLTPKSWAEIIKQTMQGTVLTPASEVANVVGNIVNNPLRGMAQTIAATTEGVLRMAGVVKRRTVGQPLADVGAYMGGFGKGLATIPEVLMTGSSQARLKAGGEVEGSRGFQPVRAWIRQATTEGLSANERAKLVVEGTFGIAPTMLLRPMQAIDNPFYFGAYHNALNEIGRLKVANGELKQDRLKAWLKVPDKRALELADEMARESVYQGNEGLLVNSMQALSSLGARRLGSWTPTEASKLANAIGWRPIMLFAQTPGNILQEGNKFLNPVYDLAMIGRATQLSRKARSEGNTAEADKWQRQAMMDVGYMFVSLALYGAAGALARAGLLSARPSDDKERALAGITFKANRINLSGLRRLLRGADPAPQAGDKTIDFRPLGYFGMAANIEANGLNDMWKEAMRLGQPFNPADVTTAQMAKGTLPAYGSALLDLSMMKGSFNLLRALSEGNYESWLASYFETITSMPLPNTAKSLNRITIPWMPETRSEAEKKQDELMRDSTVRTIMNQVKVKALYVPNVTPLWTKGIPLKQDAFGRPIPNTPPGRNPWIYHLADVFKTEEIQDDPVALELRRLYKATGDGELIPGDPPRQFRPPTTTKSQVPGQFLNDSDYARYKQQVGWSRYSGISELMRTPFWANLNDVGRVAAIKIINRKGLDDSYLPMMTYLERK